MAKKKAKGYSMFSCLATILFAALVIVAMALPFMKGELSIFGAKISGSQTGFDLMTADGENKYKVWLILSLVMACIVIVLALLGVLKVKIPFMSFILLGAGVVLLVFAIITFSNIASEVKDLNKLVKVASVGFGAIMLLITGILTGLSAASLILTGKK